MTLQTATVPEVEDRGRPRLRPEPDDDRARRRRRTVSRLALFWAVMSVVSEATPLGYWLDGRLSNFWYSATWVVTGLPSFGLAALFVALASALRRGRRAALVLLVLGAGAAGPAGLLASLVIDAPVPPIPVWFWAAVALHGLLLLALISQWRYFGVSAGHSTRRRMLLLVPILAVVVVLGALLVTATDRSHASTVARFGYVAQRAVADFGIWSWTTQVDVPWWINLLINAAAAASVIGSVYLLLRPLRGRARLTDEDESRLRGLLAKHGARDSLGYFALRRDKSVVFSPSGKSAVTYRVLGGVCLASGDPIGDVEAWPGAIIAWQKEADAHGWRLAVLGASEQAATVYKRDAGLDALLLGDEAVVDVASFDLQGRAMRAVRHACTRIQRAGYSTSLSRQADLTTEAEQQIATVANSWRGGGPERGFSMALSRLGDPADPDYLLMQCHDADGRLRAVLGFVPWGPDGLSLDLMRRDRDADNGLFEFMIVQLLVGGAASLGVVRVSLNFAMFREVFANGTRIGAGPFLRLQCRVLLMASKWWQLESLYRANRKYQPSWNPRFICFQRVGDLGAVAVAAGRAEGFLP